MKDWKLILIGCAIGTVCSTTAAWLVTSHPAEAQVHSPFTRCMVVRQDTVDANDQGQVERTEDRQVVVVPPGWEPVGGGLGAVVLCRR